MRRSHACKVVFGGKEESGSRGHLIRLGDGQESYYGVCRTAHNYLDEGY